MERFDLEIPGGLDPEVAVLVGAWRDGTREWLGEAGEIADEAVVRRHGKNGVSIGALMMHIVDCDEGWFSSVLLHEPNEPLTVAGEFSKNLSVDNRVFPDPPAWPFSKYVEMMKEVRTGLVARLAGMRGSDEHTSQSGRVFTVRWVLAHLVQHDSYHGGQIVLLNEDF